MKSSLFSLVLALTLVVSATAQKTVNTASSVATEATTRATAAKTTIATGTQVSGQLQSTLDVNKAKVGDQVLLKTTKAVKQNGKTVVSKGSMVVGRVTDVAQKTKQNSASRVSVLFDRLRQDGRDVSINAVITSVLRVDNSAAAASMNDDIQLGSSASTSSRNSPQASGGGLLGGVTNTVGSLVTATTNTVGGVTNVTGHVLGGTTTGATSNIRGLSISQSTNSSAQGDSTLSLTGGNLKLEKGTTFYLNISSATSVDNN